MRSVVVRNPSGPHQLLTCALFVNASNTSSRGAANVRRRMISRSPPRTSNAGPPRTSLLFIFPSPLLQSLKVIVQPLEAPRPEAAILLDPVGDFAQSFRTQLHGSPLLVAAPLDQASPLEHLQVLRNRGQTHLERCRQLTHGRDTTSQLCQDRPARRIGECCERGGEWVCLHYFLIG